MLAKLAKIDTDPYVSHLPQALIQTTGLTEAQLLAIFDNLSTTIQDLKPEYQFHKIPPALARWKAFNPLPKNLQIDYLDGGSYGYVFTVGNRQARYAFKVLRYRNPVEAEEIANGAYLTALQCKDLARFYTGNVKNVWYLSELITPHSPMLSERPGKTLAEHGFTFYDDAPDGPNRIWDIRVDYGSLKHPRSDHIPWSKYFETALRKLNRLLFFWRPQ